MATALRHIVVVAIVLAATAGAARAGRTHFGWSYGTDIVPERGTELETWFLEENDEGDLKTRETAFWWGAVFAPTQHLELAVLLEASYEDERDGRAGTNFSRWGGEVRYRFQSPDPLEAGPLATKVRFGAKRLIQDRAGYQLEADLINGVKFGRVYAAVDLGVVTERIPGAKETQFRPSGGVSIRAIGDLRFGIETYSELIVEGDAKSWLVVGPCASLTNGRIWLAGTYGIGLFGIRDAPRITFGVAL
jgi:hypothetical protein